MPQLVILAGPNGSGKTTLVQSGALDRWLEAAIIRLNADDVARQLAGGQHPSPEQSLLAAQMTDDHLDTCLTEGKSVLVETVLSSDKLKSRIIAAQAKAYEILFVFVTLRVGRLNLLRVEQRHVQGGHDVRPDLILDRRRRSHERFAWFAQQAASVLVYDNSGFGLPSYVAGKTGAGWDIENVALLPPELTAVILALAAAPHPD